MLHNDKAVARHDWYNMPGRSLKGVVRGRRRAIGKLPATGNIGIGCVIEDCQTEPAELAAAQTATLDELSKSRPKMTTIGSGA